MAFDEDILAEPIPSNYRLIGIPEYYGMTDLALHLRRFQTAALLYQYSDKLKCRKISFTLYNVRQGDDESLRDYVHKFIAAVLEIPGAHKEVLANSFVNGLTEGPFLATLVTDPIKNNDELLAWVGKFINLEEMGPTKPKSDKFCQFHNDYGHDTDECAYLRNEIEKLIKKGYHKEFVANHGLAPHLGSALPPVPPRKEAILDSQAHQRKGVIHIISDGPTIGDSNKARRAHSRQGVAKIPKLEVNVIEPISTAPVIQFSSADLERLDCPHQDALVITATIANYDVARVFVDCGSLVDILFLKAFQQMDLGPIKMEPVQTALENPSSHMFPLTLRKGTDAKTRMVRFLIVDTPFAYNVILGKPMLNLFQAVPSIYHQKIKYLVEGRVGKVRGDQYISRRCYVEAVKVFDDNRGSTPVRKADQELEEGELAIQTEPAGELLNVELISRRDDTVTRIGRYLLKERLEKFVCFLGSNKDIFAFSV
ncbi:hypothetical protein CDL12_05578 [Handroanthus impetiginosus]|uniref:Retrotransposon gag domain-containing protein n=1 Tax=Handroanthus impetiginosus TaxID=429701 RepID=A0A2G9HW71_9LAMI|nr:hypothetical protein CDL12_05578 [Handroanthus impetiginosus]